MGLCGHQWAAPGQFDDPNATSAAIIENLQRMGVPTDFAPTKLRAGFGESVCAVLLQLCDRALKTTGFKFAKPVLAKERSNDDDLEDEDPEDDEVDDEAIIDDEKDEEQLEMLGRDAKEFARTLIESKVDPAEWKLEVERVSTQLGTDKSVDQKDWRAHLEKMRQHQTSITEQLAATRTQLDKMTAEITLTLQKIDSREKFINEHFKNQAAEYKAAKDICTDTSDKYSVGSETVNRLTNELTRIQDELDKVKQKMEEASNQMSDTTPLQKIKAALDRLRKEIGQFDIRIGVVSIGLLQQRQAEKKAKAAAAEAVAAGATAGTAKAK